MSWRDLILGRPTQKRAQPWQPTYPFTYGTIGARGFQDVDPAQGENALQSVAYHSGCDLIASIVSELPLLIYSGEGPGRRKRSTPGYLEDPAGDGYGRQDWVYQWMMSWFLRGNAFGHILDQGPTGMIRQADVFHPDTVSVSEVEGELKWMVSGEQIPNRRMYHKRVNPVPGTRMGLSAVQAHAATLGMSIGSTRFGRTWFEDNAIPSGILKNELADLADDKVVQKAKDRFMAALFGSREPVVLGRGWSYEKISVSPEEAQFLATQGWSEYQCARILGPGVGEILGYTQSGSSISYANIIDRDLSLLKYAVGKWVNRVERLFFEWLPRPQYAVLDRDAFLETSALQKWQINQVKLDTGAVTINEVRQEDYRKPVAWGNEPLVLTQAAAKAESEPPPDDEPPADPPGGE